MRPRKNKIVLTKDSVIAVFAPGQRYTLAVLQHMFTGTLDELREILRDAEQNGELLSCIVQRKERIQFWLNPNYGAQPAERRMMNKKEDLRGYDIMKHWNLNRR